MCSSSYAYGLLIVQGSMGSLTEWKDDMLTNCEEIFGWAYFWVMWYILVVQISGNAQGIEVVDL